MNEREMHKEKLSKICRLCKQKLIVDQYYVCKKTALEFSQEIFDIFGHHLNDDCENVHPKFVCNKCRRKLQRYQKSPYTVFPLDVADFTKHETVTCLVCCGHLNKHIYKIKFYGVLKNDLSKPNNTLLSPILSPITSFCKFLEIASMYKFMKTSESENCYYLSKLLEISGIPVIEKSLKIYENFSWDIIAYNLLVSKENPYLALVPEIIYEENIHEFFMAVSELKICPANDEFKDLISHKLSYGSELYFLNKDKTIKAKIENKQFSSEADLKVIRSSKCDKLISNYVSRCNYCTTLRKDLILYSHRYETDTIGSKEKSPNIYKNREQLLEKCEEQHNYLQYLKSVLKRKEKRIRKLFEKESIVLPDQLNDVVSGVLKNNHNLSFPKNSPKYLLWQEQLKNIGLKNKKSARWHPLFVRFCLSIYLKSPAAYEHIRNSGFIELPHRTTLNQYTDFASSKSGFVPEIVSRLCLDLKIETLKDHERQTIIMFDEMKIKQNLIFCSTSGELRGFTELGDMNEELNEFDRCFSLETQKTKDLASHILCVMVGGLLKRFAYPLAYFCTAGLLSDQLFPIIWKAVRISETIGLEVVAVVSDGASMNRRFFKLHELADGSNVSLDGVVYWIYNRYDMDRKIFFFSDPPHLLKTLRNN
ncbi:uncharacterized protein LOC124818645 [Hydra vulgaris]|uniref:uncharacterized protein LOC124818645 n=1 Tax=Hydra vulgaris TaxID=6087 RepID=UPI001F5F239E|nr:uncharacterized protein LOC124818645 isoform X1 [Hydra vulgaris]